MISWVPFSQINRAHLQAIARSLQACPREIRHDANWLMNGLKEGALRLFEYDHGILIVHHEDNRLVIDAMEASIWDRLELVEVLRRLAADWLCDKVQTTVFDKRLAGAIVSVGGRIESYDLVLDVGTSDEQQEKDQDD